MIKNPLLEEAITLYNELLPVQTTSSDRHEKMAKLASFVIFASLFLILTTIVIDGEAQGETRSKIRSRLSSAVRKKKINLAKVKVVEPEIPTTELSTENVPSTTSAIELTSNLAEDVEALIATQAPRVMSQRVQQSNRPPRTGPAPEGCGECDEDQCKTPSDSSCPNGLVLDRCSCCYICGALEGNRCFNASLSLPYVPEIGICGQHLDCLLRNDLDPTEQREALCECRDKRIVCGSNGQTYLSECKLREAAHTYQDLRITNWSPCLSAPLITTPVENATVPIGEDVSLSCEVRAYPSPVLHWEFLAEGTDGMPQILPGDDSNIVIVVRGGPEQIMTTSWIQIISVNPKRQGSYFCVAQNEQGSIKAVAEVRVYKSEQALV